MACVAAAVAGPELDSPDAARIVEEELRSGGYPSAEISISRSAEIPKSRLKLGAVAGWPSAQQRKDSS